MQIESESTPASQETLSKSELSFNPWLRHYRNMALKYNSDTSIPSRDKTTSPENDCREEKPPKVKDTSMAASVNELVRLTQHW